MGADVAEVRWARFLLRSPLRRRPLACMTPERGRGKSRARALKHGCPMSRGVNEVNTESHRNRGRLSFATEFIGDRCLEIARHPFRWLLISLCSINRHRAPVSFAVAAAAAHVTFAVAAAAATFGVDDAKASKLRSRLRALITASRRCDRPRRRGQARCRNAH